MKINNTASWFIIIAFTVGILIVAQNIILPFVAALLIWFIVKKTRNLIDKVGVLKKYIPSWFKTMFATLVIFSVLMFAGDLLKTSIEQLSISYPKYLDNISVIEAKINTYFNIDLQQLVSQGEQNGYDPLKFMESFAYSLSELLSNVLLIAFYTIFLFMEESLFERKINMIFTEENKRISFNKIMNRIDKTLSRYAALKSLIALGTSAMSYVILVIAGIDSPIFWAFLVFMLNFIPAVGPIIATILPTLFSLIQFGEFAPAIIIAIGMGGVSVLMGNFVEPRLMGNTLNISPIVTILSLAVWGAIWGIIGMLLSVPITVALIIIFSQFKSTRNIAILLSEKGRI